MKLISMIAGFLSTLVGMFFVTDNINYIMSLDNTVLASTVANLIGKSIIVSFEAIMATIFAIAVVSVHKRAYYAIVSVARMLTLAIPCIICWKSSWYYIAGGSAKFILIFSVVQTLTMFIALFHGEKKKL